MITEAAASLMQDVVSILIASRDSALVPHIARAFGAVVDRESALLTVFVPRIAGARTFANLSAHPQVAVTFTRPRDYAAYQSKGECIGIREGTAVDRELVRRYAETFFAVNVAQGLKREVLERWVTWPCKAVELRVAAVYSQTPGPGAGERA